MAKSFKMSNGPVRALVEIHDVKRMEELTKRGFNYIMDKYNNPIIVETNKLIRSDDPVVQAALNSLR